MALLVSLLFLKFWFWLELEELCTVPVSFLKGCVSSRDLQSFTL